MYSVYNTYAIDICWFHLYVTVQQFSLNVQQCLQPERFMDFLFE